MSLQNKLECAVGDWAKKNCPDILTGTGELVEPCKDARHGHFQTNVAMISAKALKQKPRDIAQRFAEDLDTASLGLEPVQIAGPGFVNFTFKPEIVVQRLGELLSQSSSLVEHDQAPRTVLIDFSSPNVAKSMHIGHIRSTILGESLARVLKSLGHRVITDNHLGDWGTQFGKLILGYKLAGCPELKPETAVAQMEKLYQDTHNACEKDEALLERAREELRKLQTGDEENNRLWQLFRDRSQAQFDAMYSRLDIHFDHTLGESFYNPWLQDIVDELLNKGIAEESEGAVIVAYSNDAELADKPFLIQKRDGAHLYATTDLATIRYRAEEFKPDTIIYVTDGRQQLHFKQLFSAVRKWGYSELELEHVWFGAIQSKDRKPLKTRDGTPIKLKDLLDEAESRARAILKEKRPDLDETKADELARVIGLGAVKYADLMQNRNLDYVFDWDKLLAFDGNTAPYLINAYVRTRSILRKAGDSGDAGQPLHAEHELELELIRKMDAFSGLVHLVGQELRPHHLCGYLYELASLFHRFFENCPVLKAETVELKNTRLCLCRLVGDVLKQGLHLLGIQTVEEM